MLFNAVKVRETNHTYDFLRAISAHVVQCVDHVEIAFMKQWFADFGAVPVKNCCHFANSATIFQFFDGSFQVISVGKK